MMSGRFQNASCLLPVIDQIQNAISPDIGLRQWVNSSSACAQRRYHYREGVESKYTVTQAIAGTGVNGEIRIVTGLAGTPNAGKQFVMKSLPIANERTRTTIRNEAKIMLTLDHPNVARLEDAFETRTHLHLVMEYCSGKEVFDRVVEKGSYTEIEAASTMRQMLLAVNYLHSRTNPIVHRDLKPENFVYSGHASSQSTQSCVKMIDFGLALTLSHRNEKKRKSVAGTKLYSAPEVFTGEVTSKVDMWSLGVTAYTMLTGLLMFDESQIGCRAQGFTWEDALNEAFGRREFARLSVDAQSFVRGLVCIDIQARLSCEQALAHSWVETHHGRSRLSVQPSSVLQSVGRYANASRFRRACLHIMAWELSPRDCEDLRAIFEQIDTDHSGTICATEFRAALLDYFDVDHAKVDELFSCIDLDHNDQLSYSEFLAAAMQDRVQMLEDTIRSAFARFDTGNKGYLTIRDLEKNLGNSWEGVAVAELFREADPNGTWKISCDQFVDFLQGDENRADGRPDDVLVARTPSGSKHCVKDLIRMFDKGNQGQTHTVRSRM